MRFLYFFFLSRTDSAHLSTIPVMSSSMGGNSLTPNALISDSGIHPTSATFVQVEPIELVSRVNSGCIQILYRYTRSRHLYMASMVTIELTLVNCGNEDLTEIRVINKVTSYFLLLIKLDSHRS